MVRINLITLDPGSVVTFVAELATPTLRKFIYGSLKPIKTRLTLIRFFVVLS